MRKERLRSAGTREIVPSVRQSKKPITTAVSCTLVSFTTFSAASRCQYVKLDDSIYVTGNLVVQSGLSPAALSYAFSSLGLNYWHPMTWLSHMMDCELFGLNPGPHHLVSVFIHGLTAALLFFVLRRITEINLPAAFGALVWAIHPLRVESVAWIAERKDVLSGLFGLLTVLLYMRYTNRHSWRLYAFVVVCYALALMSKPTVVMLPLVLLALDRWPLRRAEPWKSLLIEKIPLLLMAGAVGVLTIIGQCQAGAMSFHANVPLQFRLENAIMSSGIYLGKIVWPLHLACFYPYPA